MKTGILFTTGLTLISASEDVVADSTSRNLAAWDFGATASSGGTSACHFMPIDEIFAFNVAAYDGGHTEQDGTAHVADWSEIEQHSTRHIAQDSLVAFLGREMPVASIDILLELDHYDENSDQGAVGATNTNTRSGPGSKNLYSSSNYRLQKIDAGSWSMDTDLETGETRDGETRKGSEKIGSLCFYKKAYDVTNTIHTGTNGKITWSVDATSDGTTACAACDADPRCHIYAVDDPLKNLEVTQDDMTEPWNSNDWNDQVAHTGAATTKNVAVHKTLGISSKCGIGNDASNDQDFGHGDNTLQSGTANGGEDLDNDVFAWALLKAAGDISFKLKVTVNRADNRDFLDTNTALAGSNGNTNAQTYSKGEDASGDTPGIYLQIDLEQTTMTYPRDLLYISGDHTPADAVILHGQESGDYEEFEVEMDATYSGAVQFYEGTFAAPNDGATDNVFDVDVQCTPVLTVTSDDGNWHCLDGTDDDMPSSSTTDTSYFTEDQGSQTGNSFDDTLSQTAACTAQLATTCEVDGHSIFIKDARHCYNSGTMQVDGSAASNPEDVCANDERKGFWPALMPTATNSFEAHSTLVEAVRLTNTRRYPKGQLAAADAFDPPSPTDRYTAGTATIQDATTNDDWECDANDCDSADPYIVLSAVTDSAVTVRCWADETGENNNGMTNSYGSPKQIVTGCDDTGTASGGYTSSSCTDPSAHKVSCEVSGSVSSAPASAVNLQLPPEQFPQFYVYGISTIRSKDSSGTNLEGDGDVAADVDANTGENNIHDGSDVNSRRLGARVLEKKPLKKVREKTIVVPMMNSVMHA